VRYVAALVERRIGEIDQQQARLRALKQDLVELRERARNLPAPALEAGVYCHVLQR
jgi:hypothetical protein